MCHHVPAGQWLYRPVRFVLCGTTGAGPRILVEQAALRSACECPTEGPCESELFCHVKSAAYSLDKHAPQQNLLSCRITADTIDSNGDLVQQQNTPVKNETLNTALTICQMPTTNYI